MNGTFEKMAEIINGREQRSAWRRGVTAYALELLEELHESGWTNFIDEDAAWPNNKTAQQVTRKLSTIIGGSGKPQHN